MGKHVQVASFAQLQYMLNEYSLATCRLVSGEPSILTWCRILWATCVARVENNHEASEAVPTGIQGK